MIVKEFRQLERDRRTLAMLIVLPVLLLVIFGYAARFDVSNIPTVVVGPQAEQVAARLGAPFRVVEVDPGAGRSVAESRLQDGKAVVGVVTGGSPLLVLMDGTQLFSVRAAQTALGHMAQVAGAGGTAPAAARAATVQILYNPNLSTSWIMIPGLTGLILVFLGTLVTSLGIVRERQSGPIEQLADMPFRPGGVGRPTPGRRACSHDVGAGGRQRPVRPPVGIGPGDAHGTAVDRERHLV